MLLQRQSVEQLALAAQESKSGSKSKSFLRHCLHPASFQTRQFVGPPCAPFNWQGSIELLELPVFVVCPISVRHCLMRLWVKGCKMSEKAGRKGRKTAIKQWRRAQGMQLRGNDGAEHLDWLQVLDCLHEARRESRFRKPQEERREMAGRLFVPCRFGFDAHHEAFPTPPF